MSLESSRRALVLNPPFERAVFRDHYCASEAKTAYLWHPLDVLIQAQVLEEAGYDVAAVDAIGARWSLERVRDRVRAHRPGAAVVLVSERTWRTDREVLEMLRAEGVEQIAASGDFLRFPGGPIEEARGLVDHVITDFTTGALPGVLDATAKASAGVVPFDDACAGRVGPPLSGPLDYPTPDPERFAPVRYRLPYAGFQRLASVLTTYGCPYHCLYCHVGELGFRRRPVDAIVSELRRARASGHRTVYFRDATLNAVRSHVLEWTDALVREDLVLPWAAFAVAFPFDDALARTMVRSGCRHLQIGVETLSGELRDANGKPFDTDAHEAFVRLCRQNGVAVTAHIVLGLPGETPETLRATVDGLAGADFDYVAVSLAENRPGIPWRERGVELAVDPASGARQSTDAMDVAELKRWQDRAYKRFYLRPGRVAVELGRRIRARDLSDATGLALDLGRWFRG